MDDVSGHVEPPRGEADRRHGAVPRHDRPQSPQPGKHRRETLGEEEAADETCRFAVRASLAAAFDEAAYEAPQQAYLALQREFAAQGIRPDPAAAFDAAFQISQGLRPVSLTAQRAGRHRRPHPDKEGSPR